MTVEEFHLLPRRLGWKHEYWDGYAHITPGHAVMDVSMPVEPRPSSPPCPLRPVGPEDEAALIAAFLAGFGDSVDYCDWEPAAIEKSAAKCIRDFLARARGEPLEASRVAVAAAPGTDPAAAAQVQVEPGEVDPMTPVPTAPIVGAALVVRAGEAEARLEMLFVAPAWRRRGLASALVSDALTALHAAGFDRLVSRYLLANADSRAWHLRFGFTEEPDWLAAGHLRHHAEAELRRREALGDLSDTERAALTAQIARWAARREEVDPVRLLRQELEDRAGES